MQLTSLKTVLSRLGAVSVLPLLGLTTVAFCWMCWDDWLLMYPSPVQALVVSTKQTGRLQSIRNCARLKGSLYMYRVYPKFSKRDIMGRISLSAGTYHIYTMFRLF